MKVYIPNMIKPNMQSLEEISEYNYSNPYVKNHLISNDGIYECVNDKIFKKYAIDSTIIKCKKLLNNFGELDLWIDNTHFKNTIVYRIPSKYILQKTSEYVYKVSKNSLVSFNVIIDNNKGTIIDYYFYTNEDINHRFVLEDIDTFLSLLNKSL